MTPRERVSLALHAVSTGSQLTWDAITRAWAWLLAPLTDGKGLSLTRFLLIFIVVTMGHAIEDHHPVSATVTTVLIAVIAASFGQKMFTLFLNRNTSSQAATDAVKVELDVAKTIVAAQEKPR